MDEDERWSFLAALDEELLKGGVILSEWCSFITREADTAFARGASLASILTTVAAIETYLRSEYAHTGRERLSELIDIAHLDPLLTRDLHELRRYRNKWVHVDEPWEDTSVVTRPEDYERELEQMAQFAARALRNTIYNSQWV